MITLDLDIYQTPIPYFDSLFYEVSLKSFVSDSILGVYNGITHATSYNRLVLLNKNIYIGKTVLGPDFDLEKGQPDAYNIGHYKVDDEKVTLLPALFRIPPFTPKYTELKISKSKLVFDLEIYLKFASKESSEYINKDSSICYIKVRNLDDTIRIDDLVFDKLYKLNSGSYLKVYDNFKFEIVSELGEIVDYGYYVNEPPYNFILIHNNDKYANMNIAGELNIYSSYKFFDKKFVLIRQIRVKNKKVIDENYLN